MNIICIDLACYSYIFMQLLEDVVAIATGFFKKKKKAIATGLFQHKFLNLLDLRISQFIADLCKQ